MVYLGACFTLLTTNDEVVFFPRTLNPYSFAASDDMKFSCTARAGEVFRTPNEKRPFRAPFQQANNLIQ